MAASNRHSIGAHKRWVVKVGSALLTNDGKGLNTEFINTIATQIAYLRDQEIEVVLVSSGSVAAGISLLKLNGRPKKVSELQASAAVGQASLVRSYETAFNAHDIIIAQVLLTHADIADRERYLNAKNTFSTLLDLNVLTVVNENDTVATEEICFGDNDNLAALVATLVSADLLVILTDQNGLYTADPRKNPDAELISQESADNETLLEMASDGGELGRGGMVTKLLAAQNASRAGIPTIIASGRHKEVLQCLYQGEEIGTHLIAKEQRLASKKQWMIGQMKVKGTVVLDQGAVKVIQQSGKSLLPIGILQVQGDFTRGELVSCVDVAGKEIARGLTNYESMEAEQIIGKSSDKINKILSYGGDDEFIHRDNLVLL